MRIVAIRESKYTLPVAISVLPRVQGVNVLWRWVILCYSRVSRSIMHGTDLQQTRLTLFTFSKNAYRSLNDDNGCIITT